jgi:Spy/CpxP family protein refolding chaperone
MKANILKFILAVSLILNISVFISAGYSYYRQHQRQHELVFEHDFLKGNGYLFENLELNPEQLKVFKEQASSFHAVIVQKAQVVHSKRSALFDLMRTANPDRQAIEAAIGEINRMQEDMQKMIIFHMLKVKTLLSKDQQKRFFDLIEESMVGKMAMPCR